MASMSGGLDELGPAAELGPEDDILVGATGGDVDVVCCENDVLPRACLMYAMNRAIAALGSVCARAQSQYPGCVCTSSANVIPAY